LYSKARKENLQLLAMQEAVKLKQLQSIHTCFC